MADTYTTNLNLTKPEPGAAEDTWGISLNSDLDTLDAIFSSSGTQVNLNPNQVNFADNKKAIFGTDSDLQIYHDGSASYIDDTGTGPLYLKGNAITAVNLSDAVMFTAIGGNKVGLNYNGNEKLATTSQGISVTGLIQAETIQLNASGSTNPQIQLNNNDFGTFDWLVNQADSGKYIVTVSGTGGPEMELESDGSDYTNAVLNVGGQRVLTQTAGINLNGDLGFNDGYKAIFGTGSDLEIYHNGSHSFISESGTGNLQIQAQNLSLEDSTGTRFLLGIQGGETRLYNQGNQKVAIQTTGIDVTGTVTSDGLTVDGNISKNSNYNITNFFKADGSTRLAYILFRDDNPNYFEYNHTATQPLYFVNNNKKVLGLESNSDISFYDDTGTSQNMVWDASADTLNFVDNAKAIFGTGSDLQIYHDSLNSYIVDAGTGDLIIQAGNDLILNDPNSLEYLRGNQGAGVEVKHNGSTKLLTTSTGIDVTGTVTSDGLTLGANDKIQFGTSDITGIYRTNSGSDFTMQHWGNLSMLIDSDNNDSGTRQFMIGRNSQDASTATKIALFSEGGDISFYDDTGTTQGVFWDASAESLGIGTSSPARTLHVNNNGESFIRITSSDTGNAGLEFGDQSDGVQGAIYQNATDNSLRFNGYNNAERARIDSSGNLLVGTSSTAPYASTSNTASGISLRGEWGLIGASRVDNYSLSLNRANSDGEIINLRKSGSTVGRISTTSTGIAVGTPLGSGSGIHLISNAILPSTSTGGTADGSKDLGSSSSRFKDLHLSGTGYFGTSVGVGTTNPTGDGTVLHIHGSTASTLHLTNSTTGTAISDGFDIVMDGSDALLRNRESAAIKFRIGSSEAMRIDSNGRVGIKNSSPSSQFFNTLVVGDTSGDNGITIQSSATGRGVLAFSDTDAATAGRYDGFINYNHTSQYMSFHTNTGNEHMRIDNVGNLLIGQTVGNVYNQSSESGFKLDGASGNLQVARSGGTPAFFNRLTSDGTMIDFRRDGVTHAQIGILSAASGSDAYFASGSSSVTGTGLRFISVTSSIYIAPCRGDGTTSDNYIDLGSSSARFDDIYATNGTIQTSDINEKQDIEDLSEAETRVAVVAKGLLKKYRWKSAVADKGDDARIHFGIMAQDLENAFANEGLDAGDYGMFISSTWTDEATGEEKTRLGVRYNELLAFIIAAI